MGRSSMPVENGGDIDLCLFVEPWCDDYWMKPGETLTLRSEAEGIDVWFHTSISKGCVTVWLYEDGDGRKLVLDHAVFDAGGNRLESGHQRPLDQRWSAAGPIID
ncbi:hypothetical protein [Streptomyces sp. NBC_01565]|uniref:hypothetical protein n=1 Tax=unclassified Streptomyces TaxID=2593676 RepID=UPI0022584052|nr:hypothetical protein [Streptomyces sp. NBC_01565]MCX4546177.1 hypothetical protein [Streptomyces sp. NBC_01565]